MSETVRRGAWGAALDALEGVVRDHRVTISVVFPLVGMALLVGSREGLVPPPLAFDPTLILIGTAVMRLPLLVGLAPVVDRRAAVGVGALVAFTYAVELLGVLTGVPYGSFSYGVHLGPMLFGLVPVGLPVFYLPLVFDAYLLVLALAPAFARRRLPRVAAALLAVVVVDLVLDPAAVSLTFWSYGGGVFYGVPLSNYVGWLVSGTVALALVEATFDADRVRRRLRNCEFALDDLVSFVVLWGAIDAVYGNWLAVAFAAALLGALVAAGRFDLADRVDLSGRSWP